MTQQNSSPEKYSQDLPQSMNRLFQIIRQAKEDKTNAEILQQAIDFTPSVRSKAALYGFIAIEQVMLAIGSNLSKMQALQQDGNSVEMEPLFIEVMKDLARSILSLEPNFSQILLPTIDAQELNNKISSAEFSYKDSRTNEVFLSTLLVVDPDQPFLELMEKLGRRRLVEVLKASNAADAYENAQTRIINAALFNIELGDGNLSLDLAQQIRQLGGYANLPIAFVSDKPQIYNRVAAAQVGGMLYLTKPISNLELEDAFEQLLIFRQPRIPRILVLDDDEALSSRIASVLEQKEMEVVTLNDPVRIIEALDETVPDLLILDAIMPGISGLDVCRILRNVRRWKGLPILFLSSPTTADVRHKMLEFGGDDYLIKPCLDDELVDRVKVRLDRSRQLKEKSRTDPLTGFLLRQPFWEQLSAMLASAETLGFPVCISLLAINHLKSINSQFGYDAGDIVLSNFGKMFSRWVGHETLRGRWSGDEFIVAFFGKTKTSVAGIVKAFLQEYNQIWHSSENNRPFRVRVTTAMADYPNDGGNVYELIKAVDERLTTYKQSSAGADNDEGNTDE